MLSCGVVVYAAFGEFSLLTGETRSATVRAETDCVLYELSRSKLDQFAAEAPPGALILMTNIARLESYRVRLLKGSFRRCWPSSNFGLPAAPELILAAC